MSKPLIPILSDQQVELAGLRNYSPNPDRREPAWAFLKLIHGLAASLGALIPVVFLLALLLGYTSSALAQGNFVYVNNNVFGGPNTVSAYSVGADCSLTPVPGSPFPTGGTAAAAGAGGANQAEVCGNNLYVGNSLSNTITVFAINPATGALSPVGSPVPVAGDEVPFSDMNFSCSPDGRFLYVVRSGSGLFMVYRRAADGSLTFVTFAFPGGFSPSDIEVSPNGAFLLVSTSESRKVVPFTINQTDGRPTMGTPVQIAQGPHEIEMNCDSTLAFVGSFDGVYVFSLGPGGALTLVPGSPFVSSGERHFDIQLSPDGRFLFVSHDLSNTISVMSVGAGGALTEIAGSPFPNTGGSLPMFTVTNASGTCLFALNQGATAFQIAADGSLTRVGAPTGGSSGFGGGIAAYPAASCAPNLTVPQQITQLITQVQNLIANGVLNAGQGAGLIAKLNGIIAKLDAGQTRAACNQFNAFINQVNAFVNSGALSSEQGQALITVANNIRAQIGC
jgi:6-phosphogluconolactonase